MKIAIISTSYPTNDDGSEAAGSFVKDFVYELVNQGHEVAIVAPVVMGGDPKIEQKTQGLHYFWFCVPKLPLSLLSPKKPQDWWPVYKTLQQGKKATDQMVNDFQPDHVFALWALPSGHWARYAKKRYGIPYSIWALGSDIWSLGKIPVVKNYLKKVLQDADHRFADGYQLAEDVTGICHKPCEFLPSTRQLPVCGLPLTQSKPSYRLCFLGRWHPNKGIDLLLEALHLLEDSDWDNIEEVRIAGGGPMENLVRDEVTKLQNKGRSISLSGFQDKLGAAELLIWTDYVIIPSRVESIPVVFSDAMQTSRPVIAMPVGDLPKLVTDNMCGLLVSELAPQTMVNAIQKSLNTQIDSFMPNIRNTLNTFNLTIIIKKFISRTTNK